MKKVVIWLTAAAVMLTAGGCGGDKEGAVEPAETPKTAKTPVEETEAAKKAVSEDTAVSENEEDEAVAEDTVQKKTKKKNKKKKKAEETAAASQEEGVDEEDARARAEAEAQAKAAEEAARAQEEARAAEEARIAEEEAQRLAAEQAAAAAADQAVIDQDIPQDPTAPSAEEVRAVARDYVGRPMDELTGAIGAPSDQASAPGCNGPGSYDVTLTYNCTGGEVKIYVYQFADGSTEVADVY